MVVRDRGDERAAFAEVGAEGWIEVGIPDHEQVGRARDPRQFGA